MPRSHIAGLTACGLQLAGCASSTPINLASQFTPPQNVDIAHAGNGACTTYLASVRDMRADTQSMGFIGPRPIRAADSAGWLRSGFQYLSHDSRIGIADAGNARLVLNVELLKAYLLPIATDKSTTLVVRVRYTMGGSAPDEQIYRGVDTAMNWDAGGGETQNSFDDALSHILKAVESDILARCGGVDAKAGSPPR